MSREFRIAYLCHEYPKYSETFVYREVERLSKLGVRVTVFAMKRPARPDAVENAEEKIAATRYLEPDFSPVFLWAQLVALIKSPLRYTGLLAFLLCASTRKSAISLKVRIGFLMRGALLAHKLASEKDIRILHSPATGDELIAAHAASVLSGVPLSFTLHAPFGLFIASPLLKRQALDSSLIASISEDARKHIVSIASEKVAGRIRVIHCGVDLPEKVRPVSETAPKVLSVASLLSLKGHDVLIRAIGILRERGVAVSCDIVGEGSERPRLEKFIGDLRLDDAVHLLGGQPPSRVKELMQESRAFALAARVDAKGDRDGIPVALMEAMAHSRPCVSTRVAGIPELVADNETGFLVGQDDPEALADAIARLIADPALAARMGEKGRERVSKEFSLDRQAGLLKAEFDKLAHTVAYVSHEFPKITETFVKREVAALEKAGVRLRLFSIRKPEEAVDNRKGETSLYCILPSSHSPNFYLKSLSYMLLRPSRSAYLLHRAIESVGTPGTWRPGWGVVLDVLRGALVAKELSREVSGIHASFAGVSATVAWAAGKFSGKPFGFSSHSSPPDPLLKTKCEQARWIFSESEFDKRYLIEIAGESVRDKIRIVRCGLNPEDWPEPDWNSPRYSNGPALFVGTLGPKKGVTTLMDAIISISKKGSDITIDIVGDGPLKLKTEEMVRNAGVGDKVRFHGLVGFDKLIDFYKKSRFLVLPCVVTPEGDRDGIPVTLIEALASGIPCISTPVSGIPELIEDSVNGLIIPPGDAGALANAIESLWNDPDRCREMGRRGREKALELFDMGAQTDASINELINRGVLGQKERAA